MTSVMNPEPAKPQVMRDEEICPVRDLLAESPKLRRVGASEFALFDLYDLAASAEGEFGTAFDPEAPSAGDGESILSVPGTRHVS
jgi:hypothetical protein